MRANGNVKNWTVQRFTSIFSQLVVIQTNALHTNRSIWPLILWGHKTFFFFQKLLSFTLFFHLYFFFSIFFLLYVFLFFSWRTFHSLLNPSLIIPDKQFHEKLKYSQPFSVKLKKWINQLALKDDKGFVQILRFIKERKEDSH